MWRDEAADLPALVCQVGGTQLRFHRRCIEDLLDELESLLRKTIPVSAGGLDLGGLLGFRGLAEPLAVPKPRLERDCGPGAAAISASRNS